jgi:NAD(P)H-hydrate epimerase
MAIKTLGAKAAAALDQELMSTGAFSLDQLMELAGLAVSQAVYRLQPLENGRRILVACGPGNNGMLLSLVCRRKELNSFRR